MVRSLSLLYYVEEVPSKAVWIGERISIKPVTLPKYGIIYLLSINLEGTTQKPIPAQGATLIQNNYKTKAVLTLTYKL